MTDIKIQKTPGGNEIRWTVHTHYHWSTELNGYQLHYWPTTEKFRWKDKTHMAEDETHVLRYYDFVSTLPTALNPHRMVMAPHVYAEQQSTMSAYMEYQSWAN